MLERLEQYRENNTEDNTVLNYFDENEIHPILIDASIESETIIFNKITFKIGAPIGFGLSDEEIEELRKLQREQQRLVKEQERLAKQVHNLIIQTHEKIAQ